MKPNWKNRTLFTEDNRLDETLSTKIDRVNESRQFRNRMPVQRGDQSAAQHVQPPP